LLRMFAAFCAAWCKSWIAQNPENRTTTFKNFRNFYCLRRPWFAALFWPISIMWQSMIQRSPISP